MADFPSDRPRVFLSHSKADSVFIERLYGDLQRCQIYPWLDTLEIRHGQPWLDAIFEGGIPSCDCVLVYLTKASIESQMVKKEIDSAIIKKLRDNRVAFIPYVSDSALRETLRVDIQTLQTPEWNERNYSTLLPPVVAEIWRSFMERRLIAVASEERAGRLEAELQLERIRTATEAGVFSKSEEQDFTFIWEQFNRYDRFRFVARQLEDGNWVEVGAFEFEVNARSLNPHLDEIMRNGYNYSYLRDYLLECLKDKLPNFTPTQGKPSFELQYISDLQSELQTYGLLRNELGAETRFGEVQSVDNFVFSEKMQRFKYWLIHKGQMPVAVEWRAGDSLGRHLAQRFPVKPPAPTEEH